MIIIIITIRHNWVGNTIHLELYFHKPESVLENVGFWKIDVSSNPSQKSRARMN